MTQEEVTDLLNLLCKVTKEAVTFYLDNSGQKPDQMPEFVMSTGAAHRLASPDRTIILEVNAKTLLCQLGMSNDADLSASVQSVMGKNGRIDLVVLQANNSPKKGKPLGFVEFKKWHYYKADAERVGTLLDCFPEAEFGACVIIKDAPADDNHVWHTTRRPEFEKVGRELGLSPYFVAKNIECPTKSGSCCITCFAYVRPSSSSSSTSA